jgi:ketosteroid isomerase-like protein
MGAVVATEAQANAPARAAEREIRRLLEELAQAHLRSDGAALDRIRADDYVFTTADGRLLNKTQAAVGPGDFVLSAYAHDNIRVRVYGNAAVATGRLTTEGTFRGRPQSGQFRWTRVFVKRQGRWHLVANQVTRVAQAADGA